MSDLKVLVNASLSFGLVTIPVGVASAKKDLSPKFKTICRECKNPVTQQLVCGVHGLMSADTTMKGFEIVKDQFLPLETHEIEDCKAGRSKLIHLSKFVPTDSVGPSLVEKRFLLMPNQSLSEGYWLLEKALGMTGMTGIGSCSLWGTETPCAIRCGDETAHLELNLLSCLDELVVPRLDVPSVDEGALGLAISLVEANVGHLSPGDLTSLARLRLDNMIQSRLAGVIPDAPSEEAVPASSGDLIAALKASLETPKKGKKKVKA